MCPDLLAELTALSTEPLAESRNRDKWEVEREEGTEWEGRIDGKGKEGRGREVSG